MSDSVLLLGLGAFALVVFGVSTWLVLWVNAVKCVVQRRWAAATGSAAIVTLLQLVAVAWIASDRSPEYRPVHYSVLLWTLPLPFLLAVTSAIQDVREREARRR